VRPREQVFNVAWEWPEDKDPLVEGRRLVQEYKIHPRTSCSTCHR
jgi:hypothetical protein